MALYAPNTDTPAFFEEIANKIENYGENKVIVGDYNLILDPVKDRYGLGTRQNNAKSCCVVKSIAENYYLTDIWRDRNPDTLRFSWSKQRPRLQASRIDFA